MAQPRLPYPALRRFVGARNDTNTEVAAILGISRNVALNYQRDGIPLWSADALACRLGVHPTAIWGEGWWEANHEYDSRPLAPSDYRSKQARRAARAAVAA